MFVQVGAPAAQRAILTDSLSSWAVKTSGMLLVRTRDNTPRLLQASMTHTSVHRGWPVSSVLPASWPGTPGQRGLVPVPPLPRPSPGSPLPRYPKISALAVGGERGGVIRR